ncbi:high mobility group protein D-like [Bradysia coprophila]|uniref:high mobility group protein D-like n=1 Tax=Bradysia coprophila TaxID=38358 RepID=UPI00187DB7C3|nr:high mobility group protein D-like [Bradysia coprophila]XP_037042496.1 high mobility group protein D-like [Bradysia coprophila]
MGDRPKRPLSSYMIFLNGQREQIKRENPGIKITEIAKRGGELWRALEDKSQWHEQAAEAKERYTKLMMEFEVNGGSKDAPVSRKRKMGSKSSVVALTT